MSVLLNMLQAQPKICDLGPLENQRSGRPIYISVLAASSETEITLGSLVTIPYITTTRDMAQKRLNVSNRVQHFQNRGRRNKKKNKKTVVQAVPLPTIASAFVSSSISTPISLKNVEASHSVQPFKEFDPVSKLPFLVDTGCNAAYCQCLLKIGVLVLLL